MNSYSESQKLYERACKVLAGGVSSEFRKYSQPHPLFYARGKGSRLWDVDGNEYLDFTLSQGPLILGHGHPHVLESVRQASEEGQLYAGQHLLELELAETIQRLIPCAERLRLALSGSEADHAALRLARAATGRPRFIRFEGHYHGWLDNAAFGIGGVDAKGDALPWSEGLPERVFDEAVVLPWNDLEIVERTLAREGSSIAGIITEPVMCNNGCIPPRRGYLEGLRALCDQYGCLLIFDEVITGFRLSLGGAQQHFGVTPDLAVFGKAMASGYPISVLCGKEKYMRLIAEGRVIHAGTMNSGGPTAAAALATIQVLERENVLPRLKTLGCRLMEGLERVARETGHPVLIQGFGPMFHMGFSLAPATYNLQGMQAYETAKYARFLRGMQERGIRLIGRGLWYISGAHTEADIDQAISTARETLMEMAQAG